MLKDEQGYFTGNNFFEESKSIGTVFPKSRGRCYENARDVQAETISSKKPPRSIIAAKIRSLPETAEPFVRKSLLGRNIPNLRHEADLDPSNPKTLHDLKDFFDFPEFSTSSLTAMEKLKKLCNEYGDCHRILAQVLIQKKLIPVSQFVVFMCFYIDFFS
uniref:Uncharacterized protein n=1 Tax=Ditylenchus dipsaci TaxID=166011 RepID=A0A915EGY5_9BILA